MPIRGKGRGGFREGVKPIVFHVEAAGEFRPVELTFASESEVRHVRSWRKMTEGTDAGEFAALAAKRWFYYSREGATVVSLGKLNAAIRKNNRAEIAFLLIASANWTKENLAIAFCRRTWCHHIALDFLAVHPGMLTGNQPVRGIGSGVFFSLAGLADSLGVSMLWGEATASSAPFCEKVLQSGPVEDLFVIRDQTLHKISAAYFASQKRRLATITK